MLRSTTASVFCVFPAIATYGERRTGRRSRRLLDGLGAPARRPFAQAHLAARAEVGRATGDDDAEDHAVAARAVLALAGVDQELVLHRALLAAPVAVVVDR